MMNAIWRTSVRSWGLRLRCGCAALAVLCCANAVTWAQDVASEPTTPPGAGIAVDPPAAPIDQIVAPAAGEPTYDQRLEAFDLVQRGNAALQEDDPGAALEAYRYAQKLLPDSREILYNQGVAHYRLGEFDQARELFSQSLAPENPDLDKRARFNMGNSSYAQALQSQDDPQGAIKHLNDATDLYRDVLEDDPADYASRANLERSQRLIEVLEELQKQQQSQQQNQDNQQREEDQQDQSEQQDQQQNEQSQEQQESQSDQQQEQDSEDQQQQNQQSDEQQQQQSQQQNESDQESEEQKSQSEAEPDQSESSSKPQSAEGQQQDPDQQEQPAAQPAETKPMSREEAQQLLQAIRDKERQRRAALARREQRAGRTPVERDW